MLSEIEQIPFPYGNHAERWDPCVSASYGRVSVRAVRGTTIILQNFIEREKLTFWGEAIRLGLDYLAHHPEIADLNNLANAPGSIARVDNRVDTSLLSSDEVESRGIQSGFTAASLDFVGKLARQHGYPPARMAGLILHRNAARIFDEISAARGEG